MLCLGLDEQLHSADGGVYEGGTTTDPRCVPNEYVTGRPAGLHVLAVVRGGPGADRADAGNDADNDGHWHALRVAVTVLERCNAVVFYDTVQLAHRVAKCALLTKQNNAP